MEPLRFAPRPMSPSHASTRSNSFESKRKSPLSITSSIDDNSSISGDDKSSIGSYNGRPDFAPTRFPPTKSLSASPQKGVETFAAAQMRYGAGGTGRQQIQTTLMTPQRIRTTPGPQISSKTTKATVILAPGEAFRRLPEEILLLVLAELKKTHLKPGSLSCSTCWMRELLSLGTSCKKWWSAASCMLYQDIQLIGSDSILHTKKKYKTKHGTRLKLLRRTLRSRPDLAHHVKSLKVPSMPDTAKTKGEQDEYLDTVASVVMACPNLERLPGLYPTCTNQFSRLRHALSTRKKLLEHVWIMGPSRSSSMDESSMRSNHVTPRTGSFSRAQSIEILYYHQNWSSLQTLFLHCSPGTTIDRLLFENVFHFLPSLGNLYISGFPGISFDDTTLATLPPLKSLRLEDLEGVTADGLSSFASSQKTDSLLSLSLIAIPLTSLPALARIFFHLKSLKHFKISQTPSLVLPIGEIIFLHPYMASNTLETLHWEFTDAEDEVATGILAKAMAFGGFPRLRTIRAPTDFDGALQMFCRPRDRIELPGDRYRNLGSSMLPHAPSLPLVPSPTRSTFGGPNMPSPTRSTFSTGSVKSPTRSTFSAQGDHKFPNIDDNSTNLRHKCMSLASCRRMAQHRIEAATTQPQFHILIWDSEGEFVERHELGGYIGQVHSKVYYSLKPDVDGMDESIVNLDALLDGGEEVNVRDGCTGSWRLDAKVNGKSAFKTKESWWHTERGRWRALPLEKFF